MFENKSNTYSWTNTIYVRIFREISGLRHGSTLKCLLISKDGDLGLDPKDPCKNLGVALCLGVQRGQGGYQSSVAGQIRSFRFSERQSQKQKHSFAFLRKITLFVWTWSLSLEGRSATCPLGQSLVSFVSLMDL